MCFVSLLLIQLGYFGQLELIYFAKCCMQAKSVWPYIWYSCAIRTYYSNITQPVLKSTITIHNGKNNIV